MGRLPLHEAIPKDTVCHLWLTNFKRDLVTVYVLGKSGSGSHLAVGVNVAVLLVVVDAAKAAIGEHVVVAVVAVWTVVSAEKDQSYSPYTNLRPIFP
jgi:hypothetical protein